MKYHPRLIKMSAVDRSMTCAYKTHAPPLVLYYITGGLCIAIYLKFKDALYPIWPMETKGWNAWEKKRKTKKNFLIRTQKKPQQYSILYCRIPYYIDGHVCCVVWHMLIQTIWNFDFYVIQISVLLEVVKFFFMQINAKIISH